jgi:hypothetical protein
MPLEKTVRLSSFLTALLVGLGLYRAVMERDRLRRLAAAYASEAVQLNVQAAAPAADILLPPVEEPPSMPTL